MAILLGKQICVLFGADTATTEYVATALPQFAIGFIITAINVMISAYLYSTERSGLSTSISILRSLIINSAVILILPHMFDNGAIWFSLLVYEAIVLVIATILLSRSERNGIQFKQRGKKYDYHHQSGIWQSKEHRLDADYVARVSESNVRAAYPLTVGRRFSIPYKVMEQSIMVTVTRQKIVQKLAQQGDCVIIGRCADTVLAHLHPLRIFVYADWPSKLKRCQERAAEQEKFTLAEMERRMRQIDKNRAKKHELTASIPWGAKEGYDLCINTSGREIKSLVPALAEYIKSWFSSEYNVME